VIKQYKTGGFFMNLVNATPEKNPYAFTLPEGMTRDEAIDRLKKNALKCSSLKDVYADPTGNSNILVLKGQLNKYELGIIDDNVAIEEKYSWFTLLTMNPMPVMILLSAIGVIIGVVMFLTVDVQIDAIYGVVFFSMSLVISFAISFLGQFFSNSECNEILAYAKQQLEVSRMFCSSCGANVLSGAVFCQSCGVRTN
jgi:hypothetical protein